MDADSPVTTPRPLRVLAAIANHGTKNEPYVRQLLKVYRDMRHEAHVVVLSDAAKDLGDDVEVLVGAPTADPWSLPFAYKPLFRDRVDDYDLFVYSEDDTLIEESHIDAFLEATAVLPPDRIAGFVRHEFDPQGARYYTTIFGGYHWVPGSRETHAGTTFAKLSNHHAGAFILTRDQLRRALATGGFMAPPRVGAYDMLVTAATDPYTQCGMEKVICVSDLTRFSLHHLADKYHTRSLLWVADEDLVNAQTELLCGDHDSGELLDGRVDLQGIRFGKQYYEGAQSHIVDSVPEDAHDVLSVGMGCGSTELALRRRGASVVAVPLDGVVGAHARAHGVHTCRPNWREAWDSLDNSWFDSAVLHDIVQFLDDPGAMIRDIAPHLRGRGTVIIDVPNCDHISLLKQRLLGGPDREDLRRIDREASHGVRLVTGRMVARWARGAGLGIAAYHPIFDNNKYTRLNALFFGVAKGLLAHRHLWVLEKH